MGSKDDSDRRWPPNLSKKNIFIVAILYQVNGVSFYGVLTQNVDEHGLRQVILLFYATCKPSFL